MTAFDEGDRQISLEAGSRACPAVVAAAYVTVALLGWQDSVISARLMLLSSILAVALFALGEVDRKTFRLPDLITIPLLLFGLVAAALLGHDVGWRIVSAASGMGFIVLVGWAYRRWRGLAGIGLGDAKLLAAAGAWLGMEALPSVLLWACASALSVLLPARILGHRLTSRTPVPFGLFLAFGTWIVWCVGPLQ